MPQSGKATTDGSGNQAEPAPENFPNIGNDDDSAPRSAVPQRSCFPDLGKRREVIEAHLARLVELNEKSTAERRRKTKFEPEAAACLTFRPHLAQYLKGLRGCRELMQHLNEMHDVQTIMDAVDRVLDRNVDAVSSPR